MAQHPNYRPEIDGLRAFAVLAVIINHYDATLLPSGYLGVDIFFVISGYVITRTLLVRQRHSLTPTKFLIEFYSRRVKRLLPALLLCVAVCSALLLLLNPLPRASLGTAAAALFGLSNIRLYIRGLDYFGPLTESDVFIHTWSLGVEEQFYLLFPVLLWWALRRSTNQRALVGLIAGLSLLSAIAFGAVYNLNALAAYYLLPFRSWELGAGCLVATLGKSFDSMPILPRVQPQLVLGALVAAFFLPLHSAVPATFLVVALTGLALVSLRPNTAAFGLLTFPGSIFLGRISYSLYLWHWPVLVLGALMPSVPPVPLVVLQLGLTLAISIVSYKFVEQPLRHASWSGRPLFTISCGAALAILLAVVLIGIARFPSLRPATLYDASHLSETWWADRDGNYTEKCHLKKFFRADVAKSCLLADEENRPAVFLFGDSHARNYLPTVRAVFRGYSISYVTMGYGCAYLPSDMASQFSHLGCQDYVSFVQQTLASRLRPGDVVVIGQRLLENPMRQTSQYIDFISLLAKSFIGRDVRFILLDGTFPPERPPELCLAQNGSRQGCYVDVSAAAAAYAGFDEIATRAMRETSNLYFAPLRLGLCIGSRCGQTIGDAAVWHDRGHITEVAARKLAPLLRQHLADAGFFKFTVGGN